MTGNLIDKKYICYIRSRWMSEEYKFLERAFMCVEKAYQYVAGTHSLYLQCRVESKTRLEQELDGNKM
jgi:hypothetical protein